MGYPTRLLGEGETIAFEMRPHWRSLVVPTVVLIAAVAVSAYLYGRLDETGVQGTMRTAVWIIALVVMIIWTLRPFLVWLTTQYVFTTRRVIVRTGLLSRAGRDMPLSRVNNVTFDKTPLERVLNCGTLTIQSAAEQGTLVIESVPNVESIQRDVYRLFEDDDARRRNTGNGPTYGADGQPNPGGSANPGDGT